MSKPTTGEKAMKEKLFEKAAGDLATELATMHATLYVLIAGLRNTKLTRGQLAVLDAAEDELRKSQQKFFATYADQIGGAAPERN